MDERKTPFGRRMVQLPNLVPGDIAGGLWDGNRDFSYRFLDQTKALGFESEVDSGNGSINQYVEQNRDNLRERPIGFQSSILRGIYLPKVRLRFANFTLADLEGAYFGDADLEEAKFVGANIRGVEFSDANLRGVDLRDSQGIETCGFVNTIYDEAIILPKQLELIRAMGLDADKFRVEEFKLGESD